MALNNFRIRGEKFESPFFKKSDFSSFQKMKKSELENTIKKSFGRRCPLGDNDDGFSSVFNAWLEKIVEIRNEIDNNKDWDDFCKDVSQITWCLQNIYGNDKKLLSGQTPAHRLVKKWLDVEITEKKVNEALGELILEPDQIPPREGGNSVFDAQSLDNLNWTESLKLNYDLGKSGSIKVSSMSALASVIPPPSESKIDTIRRTVLTLSRALMPIQLSKWLDDVKNSKNEDLKLYFCEIKRITTLIVRCWNICQPVKGTTEKETFARICRKMYFAEISSGEGEPPSSQSIEKIEKTERVFIRFVDFCSESQ